MSDTNDWKEREAGAFWSREKNGGEKYLTGYVQVNGERVQLVAFRNKFKQDGENTPDLRVYLDNRDTEAANSSGAKKVQEDPLPI
mgnify:FL=1